MNIIPFSGESLTMSSREIAELVEKRHDNVKRTIETLSQQGVIEFPQIEEKPTAGRPVIEYRLDRELTLTLVSGYDIPMVPGIRIERMACALQGRCSTN